METMQSFISKSEQQTIAFGRRFATGLNRGDVVALRGELGSGKTYFVKGIAQAFSINKEQVTSPTFSLIQEYEGRLPVYHFDCYRMTSVGEALAIGAEEYFYGRGLCLVEWPERIASLLPAQTQWVDIKAIGPNERQFIMK